MSSGQDNTCCVVPLKDISKEPNDECIEFCADLLERARAGEFVHLAVVVQGNNRSISHGWSTAHAGVYTISMVGGISRLAHAYNAMVDSI